MRFFGEGEWVGSFLLFWIHGIGWGCIIGQEASQATKTGKRYETTFTIFLSFAASARLVLSYPTALKHAVHQSAAVTMRFSMMSLSQEGVWDCNRLHLWFPRPSLSAGAAYIVLTVYELGQNKGVEERQGLRMTGPRSPGLSATTDCSLQPCNQVIPCSTSRQMQTLPSRAPKHEHSVEKA